MESAFVARSHELTVRELTCKIWHKVRNETGVFEGPQTLRMHVATWEFSGVKVTVVSVANWLACQQEVPSWEAGSRSDSHGTPRFMNPIDESPPLLSVRSQINPLPALPPRFFQTNFRLRFLLVVCLTPLRTLTHLRLPARLISFHLIILMICGEQSSLHNSSLCSFLDLLTTPSLLRPDFPQHSSTQHCVCAFVFV